MSLRIVHTAYPFEDAEDERRRRRARESWDHLVACGKIEVPIRVDQEGENRRTINELLSIGCSYAQEGDDVAYCNVDVGLVIDAPDRIRYGLKRGLGVTVCTRRSIRQHENIHQYWNDVTAFPIDYGIDLVAVDPRWWLNYGRKMMPPMHVGRGGWDIIFLMIAEMWADNKPESEPLDRLRVLESRAHTDGVCWHEPHAPAWQKDLNNPEQRENVRLAAEFFWRIGNPGIPVV